MKKLTKILIPLSLFLGSVTSCVIGGSASRTQIPLATISSGTEIPNAVVYATAVGTESAPEIIATQPPLLDYEHVSIGDNNIERLAELAQFPIEGTAFFGQLVWSPDSQHIAAWTGTREVRIFNASNGETEQIIEGYFAASVAWSPDGKSLAIGSASDYDPQGKPSPYAVYVVNTSTWDLGFTLLGHTDEVVGLEYSPDGSLLASSSHDGTVRIWDVSSGLVSSVIKIPLGANYEAYDISWSGDGSQVAIQTPQDIWLWDFNRGFVPWPWAYGQSGESSQLEWCRKSNLLAYKDYFEVILLDTSTGRKVRSLNPHEGVRSLSWSPDCRYIASLGINTLFVEDPYSGTLLRPFDFDYNFSGRSVAWSPDGSRIAVSSSRAIFIFGIAPTNAPPPTPGSTHNNGNDGMVQVFVPAGSFTMGSGAKPFILTLDAFWIDRTEVTNAMYALCVNAGACKPVRNSSSNTRPNYYGNAEFDNYPVIYVYWKDAKAYCEWAGRRFPTEAEWEKAARGTDGRTYPWGNASPDSTLLNFNQIINDTTAVGSYPSGASPYGALDMAGNVWEWVSSLPRPYPYDAKDGREDTSIAGWRVLRGGSWYEYEDDMVSVAYSYQGAPTEGSYNIGFRCARSP